MAKTKIALPPIGGRVLAQYERRVSCGRGVQVYDRVVPGTLAKVERISPTVFRYHVHGDDGLDYELPSQLATVTKEARHAAA